MKKIILAILFYAAACLLVLTVHDLSPTNMAGLGLDIVVYLLIVIFSIALFAKSMMQISKDNFSRIYFIINAIGTVGIVILLYRV